MPTAMHTDWFFPKKLARRLARDEVSNREVAYLMLANLLFGSVIYYGAFTWGSPPRSVLSFLEGVAVVAVTIIGFTQCYWAAGGDASEHFVKHFNCLTFGVWFWTTFILWGGYWGVLWLFDIGFFRYTLFDHPNLVFKLADISMHIITLLTSFVLVLWQVIYFAWLRLRLIDAMH